ncbi:MAG: SLC13 family permease [Anaerolineales bacterium]|jgi:Na+/H+ antiporter NhaD/arsenite permease-like protein
MKPMLRNALVSLLVISISFSIFVWTQQAEAQESSGEQYLVGLVEDQQNEPVAEADVILIDADSGEHLSATETESDGRFAVPIPSQISGDVSVSIERAHFETSEIPLSTDSIDQLQQDESLSLPTVTLERKITPAFWVAAVVFVAVLVLIATGLFHNTLATLIGVTLVFGFSYLGTLLNEGLFIFDFERSLHYVDWNVIFLIMGMMIVIAVVEDTGIFQWLAFIAYRISQGRAYVLLPILMLFTGIASAFLDNVTTMLLMTPITVQIALAMGINPLALLVPEVMASNVIGVSTLVGTPTNILIGSFASISFNDFLINLTPGVLIAFVGLVIYSALTYRKDLREAREPSEMLLERLAERGQIEDTENLKKSGVVFAGMIVLFVLGEQFHLQPAVTALMGATALLVWIRPDIEAMIEAVDWTTLVFFLALFITVGAIQEVGLISIIADLVGQLVGESIVLAMIGVTVFSAVLSTVIANIPFTAAMLPVVAFLSRTVPGAESKMLFYCLSVGSAMGGNGSLIGASANMVTAGISDSAGYPITYGYFLKKGFPALLITVALALIWLLIRFL